LRLDRGIRLHSRLSVHNSTFWIFLFNRGTGIRAENIFWIKDVFGKDTALEMNKREEQSQERGKDWENTHLEWKRVEEIEREWKRVDGRMTG
jgi:hypothetical protein